MKRPNSVSGRREARCVSRLEVLRCHPDERAGTEAPQLDELSPSTMNTIYSQLTEADTCRQFVVPKLLAAGCDTEPHSTPLNSALVTANDDEWAQ